MLKLRPSKSKPTVARPKGDDKQGTATVLKLPAHHGEAIVTATVGWQDLVLQILLGSAWFGGNQQDLEYQGLAPGKRLGWHRSVVRPVCAHAQHRSEYRPVPPAVRCSSVCATAAGRVANRRRWRWRERYWSGAGHSCVTAVCGTTRVIRPRNWRDPANPGN